MLTPQLRRAEELGLAPNMDGRPVSEEFLRDRFHKDYVAIIDQAKAITVAVLELSIDPASAEKTVHLKDLARSLKRRSNRLTYQLARVQKKL
jgi:hypothetical protein